MLADAFQNAKDAKIVHGSAGGTIEIICPFKSVLINRVKGHLDTTMCDAVINEATRLLSAGHKVTLFHEWLDMTSYDTKCRVDTASWSVRYLRRIDKQYFLLRSKLVAMGVATSGMLLGNMLVTFTDSAKFAAAMDARLKAGDANTRLV